MFMLTAIDEDLEIKAKGKLASEETFSPRNFCRKLGWKSLDDLLQEVRLAGYDTVKEFLKDNITLDQYKLLTEEERNIIFSEFKG